ncbi:hypothetical protein EB259_15010 [Salmonella enterica]|nr:hypothetical protein [Salmonella enterica]
MLYFSPRFLYFRYIPAVAARRHGLFSPHDEEFSVSKIPALLLLILAGIYSWRPGSYGQL